MPPHGCDEVRIAVLARLDGERADVAPDQVDAHVAHCPSCRAAIAGLEAIHGDLARVDYERLDIDLWPILEPRVAAEAPTAASRELRGIVGLTAVLVAWRLAQLVLDLPAPVINSIVPLALIVLVLRRTTGDPFAIRRSLRQLQ
jgi:predicted anti-sigma-YlaC factor YlaD